MKKKFTLTFAILLSLGVLALAGLYVATHPIPVLNPSGKIGREERDLLVISSLLMLIVVIPVFILTWVFAWRYRASQKKAKYTPEWEDNRLAESIWWGVPFLIIVIMGVITWITSHTLNPFRPIESDRKPLTIQVVALEWKWLFVYPEQGVAAINYVQFPEKTPIRFEITGDAPMNSFWIPALGGQIYAMPAMRTELFLIADKLGVFNGYSANISGKGFAGMMFKAVASTDEEFESWVEEAKESTNLLTFEEYLRLVEPSEYDPVTLYHLKQTDLFDRIIQQYAPKGVK